MAEPPKQYMLWVLIRSAFLQGASNEYLEHSFYFVEKTISLAIHLAKVI